MATTNKSDLRKRFLEDCERLKYYHFIKKVIKIVMNNNKDKIEGEEYSKKYRAVKLINTIIALKVYGFKCQVCDETDARILEWHHIDKRKRTGTTYKEINEISKSKDRNPNIQLLCANHHILADLRDNTSNRGLLKQEIYDLTLSIMEKI